MVSVYMSDWCRENGYPNRRKLRDIMLSDGENEEVFEAEWDALESKFLSECESEGTDGVIDDGIYY